MCISTTVPAPKQPMTNEEYDLTQRQLMLVCGFALPLRLDEFLHKINVAHAVGPMLDPTMYRDAMKNLQFIEETARAMAEAQGKIIRAAERAGVDVTKLLNK